MCRTLTFAAPALLLLSGSVAWAIINPRFTPAHLVSEADQIFAGPLEASARPLEWKMSAANQIKGKSPPTSTLNLANCEKDHLDDIQQTLKDNRSPAVLFFGSKDGQKRAYLHVMGQWVKVQAAETDRWDVLGPAPDMVGTFAGGTDMLIRMVQYLVRDPDAEVPISVGVRWAGQAKVGNVPGAIAGMAAVDFTKIGRPHLFVGSAAGDRLFRPKGEDSFEDVTAAACADTRSRRFAWVDVDGDGLADLVSWDGERICVRLAGSDGKFKPAAAGFSLPLADCLGLAPCSIDGRPGVLASTSGKPLLLMADGTNGWQPAELPGTGDEDLGQPSACIVADLDNDGFADVLQPAERGGILWKGKAGGFDKPVRSAVATGGGTARAALGDFDENGVLDIFLAGQEKNTLWENDGKGTFREVLRYGGSISYKCPPGASDVQVMDLNHDGRHDLCLAYERSDLLYHFNRGFRSLAEEGELGLPGTQVAPGQPRLGQKAVAAADFNGDGSLDLVVLLTNGDLVCYYNDETSVPGLRLRLPKGITGPITASCWQGDEHPICTGTLPVAGHSPAAYIGVRSPGECKIRYRLPGGTDQVKSVTVEDGPKDVVLGLAEGNYKASAEDEPAEAPQWAAQYIGMEVPKQVLTDQVFPARITVKNTGSAAWTGIPYSDHPHPQPVLYSQDPERNKTWGADFAYMGQGVEARPGQDFTFVSHFKAPSVAGEYGFQWRLARRTPDGKLLFFGEPTAREVIAVRRRPEAPSLPRPAHDPADKKVLDFDDFQYVGSFRVPERVGEGGAGFSETGIALRTMKDGAKRLLMNFTHPRQTLFEVEIPPLAKFENGDAKPLRVAQVKKVWGPAAMTIPKIADIDRISPNGGLCWDEGKKTLYWTFYHGYWTGGAFPVLAASKLGDDGKITHVGCWLLPKTVNKWKSYWGGVTKLPQAFAEKYTGGRTMALGFGGYYSICAACSRGPALAAVAEPDPAKDTLDLMELLSYADPAAAPRDGNYFYGLGTIWYKVPDGPNDGSWTMDDCCRSGLLIDLPDKHGYVAFVRLATGRIGYDYGAIGAGGGCHWWYIYDPKDLGAVAKAQKKPGEVLPHSTAKVSYPDGGQRVLQRLQEQGVAHASGSVPPVTGSCFDERERTLYLLKPCAVEVGKEFHPCVHVYRVK